MVPCCQAYGVGVIPWGPLASGFLTGKYRCNQEIAQSAPVTSIIYHDGLTDTNFDRLAKLEVFAKEHGHSIGELAIAWLLSHPWLSTVIAGATKIEQVSANVAASGRELTSEEIARLAQIL